MKKNNLFFSVTKTKPQGEYSHAYINTYISSEPIEKNEENTEFSFSWNIELLCEFSFQSDNSYEHKKYYGLSLSELKGSEIYQIKDRCYKVYKLCNKIEKINSIYPDCSFKKMIYQLCKIGYLPIKRGEKKEEGLKRTYILDEETYKIYTELKEKEDKWKFYFHETKDFQENKEIHLHISTENNSYVGSFYFSLDGQLLNGTTENKHLNKLWCKSASFIEFLSFLNKKNAVQTEFKKEEGK